MIFDEDFVKRIQQAIDSRDIEFLKSFVKPVSQREKKKPFFVSALMVPANRAKFLNKIDELEVDAVIVNLEDGVAKEEKEAALYAAMLFLSHIGQKRPYIVVRVNPIFEGGLREIELLNSVYPDGIRVAKVKGVEDIEDVKTVLDPDIDLHISVETKEAFLELPSFKDMGIAACYLGILDLLADLGISQGVVKISNPTVDYILAKFLTEAKAIGALAVSFVYQDFRRLDEFEEWCRYEKEMGFTSKVAISPDQARIINRIFSIDKNLLQRALYIKKRFEEMQKRGVTGFSDEKYGFIDEPVYKDALNILNQR